MYFKAMFSEGEERQEELQIENSSPEYSWTAMFARLIQGLATR